MSQQPAATAEAPKKKGRGRLVMIVVVLLVLLAGGGGAAYWFLLRGESASAAETPPVEEPGMVALDPFVVNLADPDGARFLRVTLKLVLDNAEKAKTLEEDQVARARVRSTVLEFLTQQTADRLVTPEGKSELKKQIAERASGATHGTEVIDVLFSEFVVQF